MFPHTMAQGKSSNRCVTVVDDGRRATAHRLVDGGTNRYAYIGWSVSDDTKRWMRMSVKLKTKIRLRILCVQQK